jgi:hypothetical protein
MKKSEVSIVITAVWVFLCALGGAAVFISVVGTSDIPRWRPIQGIKNLIICGVMFTFTAGFAGFVLLRIARWLFRRRGGSVQHRRRHRR